MTQGFFYLVAVMDWATRHVLAWRLSNTMDASFWVEALDHALGWRAPEILNTDSDFPTPALHHILWGNGCRNEPQFHPARPSPRAAIPQGPVGCFRWLGSTGQTLRWRWIVPLRPAERSPELGPTLCHPWPGAYNFRLGSIAPVSL